MLNVCFSPRYFAQTHTNSMEKLVAVAEQLQQFNDYKFQDEFGKRYHRLLTSKELDIVFKFLKEKNY